MSQHLCRPFFYFHCGVLLMAIVVCTMYGIISQLVHHKPHTFITVIVVTLTTPLVWVAVTALALLLRSTSLHTLSGIFGYCYCAVLLVFLVASNSNRTHCQRRITYTAIQIVIAVVVVFSWIYNIILVNWTMKLRRQLEYERTGMKEPSYLIAILEREGMTDAPSRDAPTPKGSTDGPPKGSTDGPSSRV